MTAMETIEKKELSCHSIDRSNCTPAQFMNFVFFFWVTVSKFGTFAEQTIARLRLN